MTTKPAATRAWSLTTQELQLLWPHSTAPWPAALAAGYGKEYADADTVRRSDAEVRRALSSSGSPAKASAIETLADSRISLSLNVVDPHKPMDASKTIRAYSAWKAGDNVYIANQEPGATLGDGGDVSIVVEPFAQWTRRFVNLMPRPTGPGSLPADAEVEMASVPIGETAMVMPAPTTRKTAGAAFGSREVTTSAVFEVSARNASEGFPRESSSVLVTDVRDDGRYALLLDSPGYATGVTDESLAKLLNRVINRLRRRQEQSAGGTV